ncbi:hypothetical protein [Flavobacterium sp. HTF]|uniref:hypothetical protein n=1 Tax=Flavobacterium sp. HTF TaxID=2170732 RepID=UPI000D5FBB31|nr:hypothetical protein [Flavobacterium sp. HTF]PWB20761.1 hypothetical protein DCO46_20110 [Flavobacterium sp. HTF]
MKTEIKEMSKLPDFVFILFGIQFIIFLFLFTEEKKADLGLLYILLPITLILVFLRMTVILDAKAFRYKLFPFQITYRTIEWDQIEKIQISKIDALSDFLGWGLRYSKKYGWSYIFNSNNVISLIFKNGKKVTMTIKNKEEVVQFLNDNKISFNI